MLAYSIFLSRRGKLPSKGVPSFRGSFVIFTRQVYHAVHVAGKIVFSQGGFPVYLYFFMNAQGVRSLLPSSRLNVENQKRKSRIPGEDEERRRERRTGKEEE